MKQIGILGLGWLGAPLARNLMSAGFQVKGTTTTSAKKELLSKQGLNAFQLKITPKGLTGEIESFFCNVDVLIVNIPPKVAKDDANSFIEAIQHLKAKLLSYEIQKVIYISTTSVFKDAMHFPTYTEASKPNANSPKAIQLIEAEHTFLNLPHTKSAIVRFGGLVGEKRHPVFYLAGKKNLANPEAPVNLIHLEDCISLIKAILLQDEFNQIFHGVNSTDLSKSDFYTTAAENRNLDIPIFEFEPSFGKKISADFTESKLQIQLIKKVI